MDVSVIIINYNTFELTKNAIHSIIQNTENLEYEIILLDNNSSDNSGALLQKEFGEKILYIQCGENLGTSKAFNKGIRYAKGKYVLWLNPDILFKDNFIWKLYKYMEQTPDCGICGGNLFDMNNTPIHSFRRELPSIRSIKRDYSLFRAFFRKLFRSRLSSEFNYKGFPIEVGYITGADMMVRKELLDQFNGFDEDIFMYAEEVEFTFRVKKNTDYKVMSVPAAEMYHLEGASFGKGVSFSERRFKLSTYGLCICFLKCYGEKDLQKLIEIKIKSYKKYMRLLRLLSKHKKAEEYKRRLQIVYDLTKELKEQGKICR